MNGVIRKFAAMSFDIELDRRNFEEFSTDSYGIEKFAQLIVEETIHAIIKGGHGHLNPSLISKSAKEHFGI
jgi:hypothetical protein